MKSAVDAAFVINGVTDEGKQHLRSKIERGLSRILNDKHNIKITLKFAKQENANIEIT